MADRVVYDRVAILTADAQIDPRFSSRDSIRVHRLRSAMCAPLWKGDAVIGIIHVDTPVQANSFTKADLELLSALANYAAVAIEQARLNQKIRDERFARERLEKYFSPPELARLPSEGEKYFSRRSRAKRPAPSFCLSLACSTATAAESARRARSVQQDRVY